MTMRLAITSFAAVILILFAPHAVAEVDSKGSSAAMSAVRAQYSTALGPITLEVPKGYVGLSQVDPGFFDSLAASFRKGGLRTLEIFITAEDLLVARQRREVLRELVVLQLPAPNTPPMDEAIWKSVRSEMLKTIGGDEAAQWIDSAEVSSKKRFNEVHNQNFIKNIEVGKVVIYHAGQSEIRWMTKSDVAYQTEKGPGTYTAIMASALIRKEQLLFFLQSVATESSTRDALEKLDEWVSALR